MNKLRILLLFIPLFQYSCITQQNSGVNKETIIVFFDENESHQKKWKESNKSEDKKEQSFRYLFYFNKVDNIQLTYKRFKDFGEMEKDNPELFLEINKSFLRKNENLILTHKEMIEMGYEHIFKLFNNAKHILLIDKQEIKGDLITIKEVKHFYVGKE